MMWHTCASFIWNSDAKHTQTQTHIHEHACDTKKRRIFEEEMYILHASCRGDEWIFRIKGDSIKFLWVYILAYLSTCITCKLMRLQKCNSVKEIFIFMLLSWNFVQSNVDIVKKTLKINIYWQFKDLIWIWGEVEMIISLTNEQNGENRAKSCKKLFSFV